MRSKSWQEIVAAIEPLQITALFSEFSPVPDNVFKNYASQGAAGQFAKIPVLTGTASDEAAFFLVIIIAYINITKEQLGLIPVEIIQPLLDIITTCPAAQAAAYRVEHGVPVWRYRYDGGNYSNTYIFDVGAAYHTPELPVVFGTAEAVTGIADSDYEAEAAAYMRHAWATFAKDPVGGLSEELNWPKYNPNPLSPTEIQLSLGQATEAILAPSAVSDAFCPIVNGVENHLLN
ncbi:hypothetical protein MAP00_001612 [Monascus purpureus]|nr:hypothetical protein MAP00_001612 [Monascus purpureus]